MANGPPLRQNELELLMECEEEELAPSQREANVKAQTSYESAVLKVNDASTFPRWTSSRRTAPVLGAVPNRTKGGDTSDVIIIDDDQPVTSRFTPTASASVPPARQTVPRTRPTIAPARPVVPPSRLPVSPVRPTVPPVRLAVPPVRLTTPSASTTYASVCAPNNVLSVQTTTTSPSNNLVLSSSNMSNTSSPVVSSGLMLPDLQTFLKATGIQLPAGKNLVVTIPVDAGSKQRFYLPPGTRMVNPAPPANANTRAPTANLPSPMLLRPDFARLLSAPRNLCPPGKNLVKLAPKPPPQIEIVPDTSPDTSPENAANRRSSSEILTVNNSVETTATLSNSALETLLDLPANSLTNITAELFRSPVANVKSTPVKPVSVRPAGLNQFSILPAFNPVSVTPAFNPVSAKPAFNPVPVKPAFIPLPSSTQSPKQPRRRARKILAPNSDEEAEVIKIVAIDDDDDDDVQIIEPFIEPVKIKNLPTSRKKPRNSEPIKIVPAAKGNRSTDKVAARNSEPVKIVPAANANRSTDKVAVRNSEPVKIVPAARTNRSADKTALRSSGKVEVTPVSQAIVTRQTGMKRSFTVQAKTPVEILPKKPRLAASVGTVAARVETVKRSRQSRKKIETSTPVVTPTAVIKRQSRRKETTPVPPPPRRRQSKEKVEESISTWIPLDEYYYGKKEGDPSYREDKSEYRFKCWYCHKMLYNNLRLMVHMQGHIDSDRQQNLDLCDLTQCKHCYRQFDTPFEMQCHVEKVHQNSSNVLICRICEKDHDSQVALRQHMKSFHKTCEMPYVCKLCNYRSSIYNDVVDHFKKRHDSSQYIICLYCMKIFTITFCKAGWGMTQNYYQHIQKHQNKGNNKKCCRCKLTFLTKVEADHHRLKDHLPNFRGTQSGSNSRKVVNPNEEQVLICVPESDVMLTNPPMASKAVEMSSLRFTGVADKHVCLECRRSMNTSNHYKNYVECSLCRFATLCNDAFSNHMMICHSGLKIKINTITGKETQMEKTMFCLCGFSSSSGRCLANHLVSCSKRTCYATRPEIKYFEYDDEQEDVTPYEPYAEEILKQESNCSSDTDVPSLFGALGLIKKPRRHDQNRSKSSGQHTQPLATSEMVVSGIIEDLLDFVFPAEAAASFALKELLDRVDKAIKPKARRQKRPQLPVPVPMSTIEEAVPPELTGVVKWTTVRIANSDGHSKASIFLGSDLNSTDTKKDETSKNDVEIKSEANANDLPTIKPMGSAIQNKSGGDEEDDIFWNMPKIEKMESLIGYEDSIMTDADENVLLLKPDVSHQPAESGDDQMPETLDAFNRSRESVDKEYAVSDDLMSGDGLSRNRWSISAVNKNVEEAQVEEPSIQDSRTNEDIDSGVADEDTGMKSNEDCESLDFVNGAAGEDAGVKNNEDSEFELVNGAAGEDAAMKNNEDCESEFVTGVAGEDAVMKNNEDCESEFVTGVAGEDAVMKNNEDCESEFVNGVDGEDAAVKNNEDCKSESVSGIAGEDAATRINEACEPEFTKSVTGEDVAMKNNEVCESESGSDIAGEDTVMRNNEDCESEFVNGVTGEAAVVKNNEDCESEFVNGVTGEGAVVKNSENCESEFVSRITGEDAAARTNEDCTSEFVSGIAGEDALMSNNEDFVRGVTIEDGLSKYKVDCDSLDALKATPDETENFVATDDEEILEGRSGGGGDPSDVDDARCFHVDNSASKVYNKDMELTADDVHEREVTESTTDQISHAAEENVVSDLNLNVLNSSSAEDKMSEMDVSVGNFTTILNSDSAEDDKISKEDLNVEDVTTVLESHSAEDDDISEIDLDSTEADCIKEDFNSGDGEVDVDSVILMLDEDVIDDVKVGEVKQSFSDVIDTKDCKSSAALDDEKMDCETNAFEEESHSNQVAAEKFVSEREVAGVNEEHISDVNYLNDEETSSLGNSEQINAPHCVPVADNKTTVALDFDDDVNLIDSAHLEKESEYTGSEAREINVSDTDFKPADDSMLSTPVKVQEKDNSLDHTERVVIHPLVDHNEFVDCVSTDILNKEVTNFQLNVNSESSACDTSRTEHGLLPLASPTTSTSSLQRDVKKSVFQKPEIHNADSTRLRRESSESQTKVGDSPGISKNESPRAWQKTSPLLHSPRSGDSDRRSHHVSPRSHPPHQREHESKYRNDDRRDYSNNNRGYNRDYYDQRQQRDYDRRDYDRRNYDRRDYDDRSRRNSGGPSQDGYRHDNFDHRHDRDRYDHYSDRRSGNQRNSGHGHDYNHSDRQRRNYHPY